MAKMEDDQNGSRPKLKMTKMEEDQNQLDQNLLISENIISHN